MEEARIGAILSSRPDDDDARPPESFARCPLEYLDRRGVERGVSTAKYNSQGVVSKSIDAGGEAEHQLADGFETQARAFRGRWRRSAAVLDDLTASFRRERDTVTRKAEQRRPDFDR